MLSFILLFRKFQGFQEPGTVDEVQIHTKNMATTHIHTQKILYTVKTMWFDNLNFVSDSQKCNSLLSAGKTQPENLFAVVVSNSFQTLPGGSVEQLCNLHICCELSPQSQISISVRLCALRIRVELQKEIKEQVTMKYKQLYI